MHSVGFKFQYDAFLTIGHSSERELDLLLDQFFKMFEKPPATCHKLHCDIYTEGGLWDGYNSWLNLQHVVPRSKVYFWKHKDIVSLLPNMYSNDHIVERSDLDNKIISSGKGNKK